MPRPGTTVVGEGGSRQDELPQEIVGRVVGALASLSAVGRRPVEYVQILAAAGDLEQEIVTRPRNDLPQEVGGGVVGALASLGAVGHRSVEYVQILAAAIHLQAKVCHAQILGRLSLRRSPLVAADRPQRPFPTGM